MADPMIRWPSIACRSSSFVWDLSKRQLLSGGGLYPAHHRQGWALYLMDRQGGVTVDGRFPRSLNNYRGDIV